jgi:hypothetical protein
MSLLHLVRDPRACAYSWAFRRKGAMQHFSPVRAGLLWLSWNLCVEVLRQELDVPFLRVTYEDFAAEPELTCERIARFAGLEPRDLPFVEPGVVRLGSTHTVWGNPDRGRTGPVNVTADVEWADRLPRVSHAAVTAITSPLRHRYGYAR